MPDRDSIAKYELYLAIFLGLTGYGGIFAALEPVNNQFFAFAAWTYLLLTDYLAYRLRGESLLISRTPEFFVLAAWSMALCAAAELLNLRLEAWSYVNQSYTLAVRWTGRLLSWASVLPSLFITAELLDVFTFFGRTRTRPFKPGPSLPRAAGLAGGILLILAAAMPGDFWPLAVPAAFLLAEAACLKLGLPSLLREISGGFPAKGLRLAAAGLVCGFLWNWWNTAAGSGWEYALPRWLAPFPRALYAGFPLLALCAYSICSLASWLRSGRGWERTPWVMPGPPPHPALPGTVSILLIITSYIALRAVDFYTVKLYLGWV